MDLTQFSKVGLTEAESKIYYTVLKLGVCTVREVSKDSGFHRTNIYDILEQLKEKGLITFVKEGMVMKYKISDPNNLYEFLREKKDSLDAIFPEILKLSQVPTREVQVEVYKGEEGMKAAFRDLIREGKTLYVFGAKGQLREYLPVFAKQWFRDIIRKKIKCYGIYTERNPPPIPAEIRHVPQELSGPVATFIYGDKININIWEPTLVAIVIRSPSVAQMYKKHFDLLWRTAKK